MRYKLSSSISIKLSYLLVFVLTTVSMVFINRFSPLYSSFTAQDVNVYSDIGRAALHGKVLYKDVFDHKGPALLLIYGVFDLLSVKNYIGEWILFYISTTLFNIGIFKLSSLYIDRQLSILVVALSSIFMYMQSSYYISCGTPEELFLPIYLYIIYGLVLLFQNQLSNEKKMLFVFFLGFSFSFILFSKLNLTLFPAVVSVIVFCYFCKLKKKFPIFETMIWIVGILSVFLPILIYLVYNQAIRSFIDAYILFNLSYASDGNGNSLIISLISGLGVVFKTFYIHILVFFSGMIVALIKRKFTIGEFVIMVLLFFFTVVSEITTGRVYYYSMLTFLPFVVFGLIFVVSVFNNNEIFRNKSLLIILSVILSVISVFLNNGIFETQIFNRKESGIKRIADYILAADKNEENIKILQYGYSANGIYTFTGSYPEFFYFYTPGDNTDNMDFVHEAQIQYIVDGLPDFCVCTSRVEEYDWHLEEINGDYVLIDKVEHKNENNNSVYISLYQKR